MGVKGAFSQPPLNTLVGMTRGVGYFVKGVEPPKPPHKYSPDLSRVYYCITHKVT